MVWGSSTRRGGGRKVRALPRKFVFLGFRREEFGMSREFCRDVPDPWGCSKSLCRKSSCAFFVLIERGGTASLHLRTCVKRNAVFGARFKGLSLYFLFVKKGNLIRIKTGLDTYLTRIQTRTPCHGTPLMIILGGGTRPESCSSKAWKF